MSLPVLTAALLLNYSTFIIDLDGTIKVGNEGVPFASDLVNYLYENGKRVIFVSNNDWESGISRSEMLRKLNFSYVQPEDFINPVMVATEELKSNGKYEDSIFYVLGPDHVREVLREEVGVKLIDDIPRTVTSYNFTELFDATQIPIKAVVMDSYNGYTMWNLARAINFLRRPEVEFFTLSGDEAWKAPYGLLMPDVGAVKIVVEKVSRRNPIAFGKPSIALNNYLKRRNIGAKTLVIGDNIRTDIIMANDIEADSCLVPTGVSTVQDVALAREQSRFREVPTFFCSFEELFNQLHRKL